MDLANVLHMLAGLYDAEPSKAEAGDTTQWHVIFLSIGFVFLTPFNHQV